MRAQNPPLPRSFKRIRLALARERAHPAGSSDIGYEFVAPLDRAGRIDAEAWKEHRRSCGVVRFRPGEEDDVGHLTRKPGGAWAFRYDVAGDEDDEAGYRFGDERFTVGEYVSIREEDSMRTFRVVSVEHV